MSYRRVRIYKSPEEGGDVIGFSKSASDVVDNPEFKQFFDTRRYSQENLQGNWKKFNAGGVEFVWDKPNKIPKHGVSERYVQLQPPLSEEHIQELGSLCLGGFIDGKHVIGIVDSGHDEVFVIDNRKVTPDGPYGHGIYVGR